VAAQARSFFALIILTGAARTDATRTLPLLEEGYMKRTAVVLLILCGITIPALAVKRVTIAQLEQLINTFRGKQDSDLAYQIADAQLTERLSTDRVARMSASLPGDKSRQALTAIAAASEFQYPPAAEIPATAAPDLAGQRRIMGLVADYVTKTIPLLPNFLATRTTTRFEDTPLLQRPGEFFVPYEPLHFVGASGVTVLYRNGRELEEMAAKAPKTTARGLDTWGEFGPILATRRRAKQARLEPLGARAGGSSGRLQLRGGQRKVPL
jgi:hypothetical protein